MSSSRAGKPDTPADIELRKCLVAPERRSFIMVAGAGSGKTTSLIKALVTVVSAHSGTLRRRRQRVACITYTEVAAGEIWADVGNDPLVHVSTIHSFLWTIARTFQADIRTWAERRTDERIADLETAAAAFGPRVQQRTRDKNARDVARYETAKALIPKVQKFSYGTGSDYPKGMLGHDDIIRMATAFLRERPLFRTLLMQQFPFVFVDESQDTQDAVVQAMKAVALQSDKKFCLGFFGDPMQRIYATGAGAIPAEEGWFTIDKEENFRCPKAVLAVANAIRRAGDDLVQKGGRAELIQGELRPLDGTARIFVLPADFRRDGFLTAVREMVARENDDPAWREGAGADVKLLVIVHRMAAARLGFADLYAAMNDKAPSSFSDGFLDASAWPLRPFERFVLPMVEAVEMGREFKAMTLLRNHCPLLTKEALLGNCVSELLGRLRAASHRLHDLLAVGSAATNRDVLALLRDAQLVILDPRILAYLEERHPALDKGEDDGEETSREIAAMDAFLACPAEQFRGYGRYVQQQSPFSTQQGIKGTEFERVLVVLDDDEGTHAQFSYDKYFGVKEPSKRDIENVRDGKETAVERTRRLFYVCCTRALTDLVVVYFSTDPVMAERQVRAAGIFPEHAVLNEASLS
jgi:DNA helicase II / ATP-dependent DNA helicase PcrA